MRASIAVAVLAVAASLVAAADQQATPFLGKWNMTGLAPDTNYVYWLEVKQSGDQLTRDVSQSIRQSRAGDGQSRQRRARLSSPAVASRRRASRRRVDRSIAPASTAASWCGSHTAGGRRRELGRRPTGRSGQRRTPTRSTPTASPAVFRQHVTRYVGPGRIRISRAAGRVGRRGDVQCQPGREGHRPRKRSSDFKVEAAVPPDDGSNSGIYLRGRYELQLLDEQRHEERPCGRHMPIYGRKAPM